jgi:hypothetical protein
MTHSVCVNGAGALGTAQMLGLWIQLVLISGQVYYNGDGYVPQNRTVALSTCGT